MFWIIVNHMQMFNLQFGYFEFNELNDRNHITVASFVQRYTI